MLKRNMNNKPGKKKKGQSTVEYIILVAGVLAVLLVFLGPSGVFQGAFNSTLATGTNGMQNMAAALQNSRNPAP